METQHGSPALHRSLGVTLWELFNNAAQPYANLSDLDVLNQVIRERDMKLPKPQLELPYSERWLVASILPCDPQKQERALGKVGGPNKRT